MSAVYCRTATAKLRAFSRSTIGWCLFAIFVIAAPRALDAAANASRDEPAAPNQANYWFLSMIAPTILVESETLGDGVIWGNGAIWDNGGINGPIDCSMSTDSETPDVTSLTILWCNGPMLQSSYRSGDSDPK